MACLERRWHTFSSTSVVLLRVSCARFRDPLHRSDGPPHRFGSLGSHRSLCEVTRPQRVHDVSFFVCVFLCHQWTLVLRLSCFIFFVVGAVLCMCSVGTGTRSQCFLWWWRGDRPECGCVPTRCREGKVCNINGRDRARRKGYASPRHVIHVVR